MDKDDLDPVILKVRAIFKASGKTLDELGVAMGHEGDVARKSAWQFLNKTVDPRLSMLQRFAKAMDISLEELLAGNKTPQSRKRTNQNGDT